MMRAFLVAALWAVSFAVYMGNGETISSYDALPTTVIAFNALEHHTLNLDQFRSSDVAARGAAYAFVEAPNGHLVSLFPMGTALVTAPAFATLYAVRTFARGVPPPIASPSFEDERRFDEKLVAAFIAACAVALCFVMLRLVATPFQAAVGTFVFGFAGELWTIGSQGLWQHGPVCLMFVATITFLLQSVRAQPARARAWIAAAGLGAGLMIAIRPTSVIFVAALLVFVVGERSVRRWWPAFVLGALVGVAPELAWNVSVFHSLAGGYAGDVATYDATPSHVATALMGLLVSPSRGWFVFSPIVAFAIAGAVRAARRPEPAARMTACLSVAALVLVVQYAFYAGWIGGACYGPRFLTDCSPVVALAIVFVLPERLGARRTTRQRAWAAVFFVLLAASTVVQIVGSYSGAAGPLWNAIPLDLAIRPERVWAIDDDQIGRNARAMFFRYAPIFPTAGAAYVDGYAADVTAATFAPATGVASDALAPGALALVRTTMRNSGTSPWFGYDTAVYNGESRVDVSFARVDAPAGDGGGSLPAQQLYVAHRVAPGAQTEAVGAVRLPSQAGRYAVTLQPTALGLQLHATRVRATRVFLNIK